MQLDNSHTDKSSQHASTDFGGTTSQDDVSGPEIAFPSSDESVEDVFWVTD
jgi:hypothetical protein